MDYFYVILLAVVVTFLLKAQIYRFRTTLFLFDTIGIGVFTIIGVEKALENGINTPIAVMMGILTAVAGGILRDTLINEVPLIFKKEIYATACLVGAIAYIWLKHTGIPVEANQVITILTIIAVRILSIKYRLCLPTMKVEE